MAAHRKHVKSLRMIKVCLVGTEVAKEKSLLESQADIDLTVIEQKDVDTVLACITRELPNILILSDSIGSDLADELCQLSYLHSPDTKTLIICKQEAGYERLQHTGFSCRGFILHEQRHAIVRSVRVVNDGESWLSRKLVTAMLDKLAKDLLADKSKPQLIKNG